MVLPVPAVGVFQGSSAFGGGQSPWRAKGGHAGLSVPLTVRTSHVVRQHFLCRHSQRPRGQQGGENVPDTSGPSASLPSLPADL